MRIPGSLQASSIFRLWYTVFSLQKYEIERFRACPQMYFVPKDSCHAKKFSEIKLLIKDDHIIVLSQSKLIKKLLS